MKIRVKVKEGVKVLHPESGLPIKNGQYVGRTPQIVRFLRDGDLNIIEQKKKENKESK